MEGDTNGTSRVAGFVLPLNGLCHEGHCGGLTYIDHVLVHSKGHAAHLPVLETALWRLRKYGLKLNVQKTVFGAHVVQYLGYTISEKGVSPSKNKLEAVTQLPPPRTLRAVREFVGMANYFRFRAMAGWTVYLPEFEEIIGGRA